MTGTTAVTDGTLAVADCAVMSSPVANISSSSSSLAN